MTEVRALDRWLRAPDLDVALNPEWNVGRGGVPGRTEGSVDAATVNAVSRHLAAIVRERRLPQKVLVVHQFREASITRRSAIAQRRTVATTLSFDGIGSPAAKAAGYRRLSAPQLFDGFTLSTAATAPSCARGRSWASARGPTTCSTSSATCPRRYGSQRYGHVPGNRRCGIPRLAHVRLPARSRPPRHLRRQPRDGLARQHRPHPQRRGLPLPQPRHHRALRDR